MDFLVQSPHIATHHPHHHHQTHHDHPLIPLLFETKLSLHDTLGWDNGPLLYFTIIATYLSANTTTTTKLCPSWTNLIGWTTTTSNFLGDGDIDDDCVICGAVMWGGGGGGSFVQMWWRWRNGNDYDHNLLTRQDKIRELNEDIIWVSHANDSSVLFD